MKKPFKIVSAALVACLSLFPFAACNGNPDGEKTVRVNKTKILKSNTPTAAARITLCPPCFPVAPI